MQRTSARRGGARGIEVAQALTLAPTGSWRRPVARPLLTKEEGWMPAIFTPGAGCGLGPKTSPHRHLRPTAYRRAHRVKAARVSPGAEYASGTHYTEKGASVNMRIHPFDPIARKAARMSTPVAGSLEELEVLARIDAARLDDIETSSGRALRRQRRALRRHWSDRGAQLG